MTYLSNMFLKIEHVSKNFEGKVALNNVSINIEQGKIYGLLGPNGAGKTTLIRIITQIFFPDTGQILMNNIKLSKAHLNSIGYMPEERGLYKKMKVGEHLEYFAKLRNLDSQISTKQIQFYIDKFDISTWLNKEISDLSKGMQQKVQFIATLLHQPKLLILDEPFSGLDPINSEMIKQEILELHKNGTTIIFSTHRMENVEEICNDIILINQGNIILEGNVNEVKQKFKQHIYHIKINKNLEQLKEIENLDIQQSEGNSFWIKLKENQTISQVVKYLFSKEIEIEEVKEILPSIHEIFISQVRQFNMNNE